MHMFNCASGKNTSGRIIASAGVVTDVNPIVLSDGGNYFVDPANFDFRPLGNADGQLLVNGGVGWPIYTLTKPDVSAIPHTKPIINNMNGGMRG